MPTLYLMLGYPGSGKTTTAKVIHQLTGAVHIWEDQARLEKFPDLHEVNDGDSSFSQKENDELHEHLNQRTRELLRQGKSVIYDTSFNRYQDRERMYKIADETGAKHELIWVKTDKEIARDRATKDTASQDTRILATVLGDMDNETFDRLSGKLEPPHDKEPYVTVDGTKVTQEYIKGILSSL